ncbi:hypothetical protein Tco_0851251 [Tanacetum coccineum]
MHQYVIRKFSAVSSSHFTLLATLFQMNVISQSSNIQQRDPREPSLHSIQSQHFPTKVSSNQVHLLENILGQIGNHFRLIFTFTQCRIPCGNRRTVMMAIRKYHRAINESRAQKRKIDDHPNPLQTENNKQIGTYVIFPILVPPIVTLILVNSQLTQSSPTLQISSSTLPLLLLMIKFNVQRRCRVLGESIDLSGDLGVVGRGFFSDLPLAIKDMFWDLKILYHLIKLVITVGYLNKLPKISDPHTSPREKCRPPHPGNSIPWRSVSPSKYPRAHVHSGVTPPVTEGQDAREGVELSLEIVAHFFSCRVASKVGRVRVQDEKTLMDGIDDRDEMSLRKARLLAYEAEAMTNSGRSVGGYLDVGVVDGCINIVGSDVLGDGIFQDAFRFHGIRSGPRETLLSAKLVKDSSNGGGLYVRCMAYEVELGK